MKLLDKSRWLALIDGFLPPALRNAPPETHRRARLTVFCCFVAATAHGLTAVPIALQGIHFVAASNAVAALLSTILPVLLRFGAPLGLVSNGIVAVLFGFVVATAGPSGGDANVALHTLAIVPGIAVLLAGRRALVGWTTAAIAFLVVLGGLSGAGFDFPVAIPVEKTALSRFPGVIGLTAGIALFALVYEWVKDRALEELAEARRHSDAQERERLRLEARFAETQKLESLGVLAGGVAHDFNNLLTAILGHASLIREAPDAPPGELAELAGEIVTASEQAADLTDQLLAYTGRGRSVREPVDLSEIVRRVESLARTGIPPDVELRLELSEQPITAIADPGKLQQVVLNLVTNASQAIEGRGRIRVRTRLGDRRPEGLTEYDVVGPGLDEGSSGDAWAVLEVEDDGRGMAPDVRVRMFDPFYTTKDRGRGLGLSAMLGIVRSHGGAVQVETREGSGTRMVVFLPATQLASRPLGGASDPAPARRTRGSALVADDDDAVRSFAARTLGAMGFEVREARNGPDAIRLVRAESSLRLLLLDHTMPGMSGSQVLSWVEKHHPDLPVILSSGHPEGFASIDRDAPKVVWLPKPYRADALRRAVAAALAGAVS